MSKAIKVTSSGIVIFQDTYTSPANSKSIEHQNNLKKSDGYIGVRGRKLIKQMTLQLSDCIAYLKKTEPQKAKEYQVKPTFITLTLPSKQTHTDLELYRHGLSRFLVTMKRRGHIQHYIWRAEVQENGNLHYHIISDRFIHHETLKNSWNEILYDLGYIEPYSQKHKLMTLDDYLKTRDCKTEEQTNKAIKAYNEGVLCGWVSPNSTDIKEVKSEQGLARYMSKYMSKEADLLRRPIKARLWGCSDTLRNLKNTITVFTDKDTEALIDTARRDCIDVIVKEYCTIIPASATTLNKLNPFLYNLHLSNIQYNYMQLYVSPLKNFEDLEEPEHLADDITLEYYEKREMLVDDVINLAYDCY